MNPTDTDVDANIRFLAIKVKVKNKYKHRTECCENVLKKKKYDVKRKISSAKGEDPIRESIFPTALKGITFPACAGTREPPVRRQNTEQRHERWTNG